jgi:hypothetical protein
MIRAASAKFHRGLLTFVAKNKVCHFVAHTTTQLLILGNIRKVCEISYFFFKFQNYFKRLKIKILKQKTKKLWLGTYLQLTTDCQKKRLSWTLKIKSTGVHDKTQ